MPASPPPTTNAVWVTSNETVGRGVLSAAFATAILINSLDFWVAFSGSFM